MLYQCVSGGRSPGAGASSPTTLPDVVQELDKSHKVCDQRLLLLTRVVLTVAVEMREGGRSLGEQEIPHLPVLQRLCTLHTCTLWRYGI